MRCHLVGCGMASRTPSRMQSDTPSTVQCARLRGKTCNSRPGHTSNLHGQKDWCRATRHEGSILQALCHTQLTLRTACRCPNAFRYRLASQHAPLRCRSGMGTVTMSPSDIIEPSRYVTALEA